MSRSAHINLLEVKDSGEGRLVPGDQARAPAQPLAVMLQASRFGRGKVLRLEPDAPTYEVDGEGAVFALEATAILDEAGAAVTLFAVARASRSASTRCCATAAAWPFSEHIVLAHADPDASNTAEAPDRVTPSERIGATVEGGRLRAELPERSWNLLGSRARASRRPRARARGPAAATAPRR